jgi:hypothetical protein
MNPQFDPTTPASARQLRQALVENVTDARVDEVIDLREIPGPIDPQVVAPVEPSSHDEVRETRKAAASADARARTERLLAARRQVQHILAAERAEYAPEVRDDPRPRRSGRRMRLQDLA